MSKHLPYSIIAVSIVLHGCGAGPFGSKLEEGTIEYALSFPDQDPNGLMGGMLPERTTLTFTSEKHVAELSAGMGIFRTAVITDNVAKAMDYHMSMMSRKIVAHLQPRDLENFVDRERPTIIHTNDLDTIAGFPCRKAIAIFSDISRPEVELWYTDGICVREPNWFGPFAEVPGVLLRYEMIQHGMRMRLDAISVTKGPVDETKFIPKEEYQLVPATTLHNELAEVLDTFKM